MSVLIHPKTITVDGLSVRYAEGGQDGPDAILMSPWPESIYAFEPAWPHLAAAAHLDDRFHESCHNGGIHLCLEAPIYGSVALGRGVEGHGSVAAGDRVVARRCGVGEVEIDNAFENGAGKPGRAGADIAGVSRGSVVFCSGAQARTASSDGPTLR